MTQKSMAASIRSFSRSNSITVLTRESYAMAWGLKDAFSCLISNSSMYHGLPWCCGLQFRGQHPLRERAKKLDQGILTIRFEMPFNVWCGSCTHSIGKGVRFNAEKKQIGMYYSTRIWSFSMRCPICSNKIEVETDPKNTEYVIRTGARRKVRQLLRLIVQCSSSPKPLDFVIICTNLRAHSAHFWHNFQFLKCSCQALPNTCKWRLFCQGRKCIAGDCIFWLRNFRASELLWSYLCSLISHTCTGWDLDSRGCRNHWTPRKGGGTISSSCRCYFSQAGTRRHWPEAGERSEC